MSYTIRNWTKFQHYKDRRPPWIKLYRELLDDPQWYALSGEAAKALIMLWLIASESEDGTLPASNVLAFRLRLDIKTLDGILFELKPWIASTLLAGCYQDAIPETETETETEVEKKNTRIEYDPQFDGSWKIYGMHGNKKAAYAQWRKLTETEKDSAVAALKSYLLEKPEIEYRKHFERYLRDRVFLDVLEREVNGCLNIPTPKKDAADLWLDQFNFPAFTAPEPNSRAKP